jgi:hypothetical protein
MFHRCAYFSLGGLLLLLVLVQSLLAGNVLSFPSGGEANASTAAEADLSLSDGVFDNFLQGAYDIRVVNKGPDEAKNVVLRFPVPEGTRFDRLHAGTRLIWDIPGTSQNGDVVCSIGDLSANAFVQLGFVLHISAPPFTKISLHATVSSETPDPHPSDNIYSRESSVAGIPGITSARFLKKPFRLEITGENLLVPQFGGSGIGTGCDCVAWPAQLTRSVSLTTFVMEGGDLKDRFPPGVSTQICYRDPFRETVFKFIVVR